MLATAKALSGNVIYVYALTSGSNSRLYDHFCGIRMTFTANGQVVTIDKHGFII